MSANFGFHTKAHEVSSALGSTIDGKTVVITGPSPTSLGALVAEYLVSYPEAKPARFVLLGRSQSKIEPLIAKLKAKSPTTIIDFIPIELTSQKSIRDAASATISLLTTANVKIDIFLANAAVMAIPEYQTTPEGIEVQFAVNFLSHFLLTNLLLEAKVFQSGSRIINISSDAHYMGRAFLPSTDPSAYDEDTVRTAVNMNNGKDYELWVSYAHSKGAQILLTRTLASKVAKQNIKVLTLHPGLILETGLMTHLRPEDEDPMTRHFANVGRLPPAVKTLEEGVSTILVAVLDPSLDSESGKYLEDCKIGTPAEYASDDENAARLWRASELLVGQEFADF